MKILSLDKNHVGGGWKWETNLKVPKYTRMF